MDDGGQVGRAYGARTTPHMYIIDPKGVLVYAGGIDDKRSANPEDIKTAKNFVRVALSESLAGKSVSTPTADTLRLQHQVRCRLTVAARL